MTCKDKKSENIVAYIHNELSDSETTIFESHIQSCEVCAEEVNSTRLALSKISSFPDITPSESFKAKMKARIAEEREYAIIRQDLVAYIHDELSTEEREKIEATLLSDKELRAELEEYKSTLTLVDSVPEITMSKPPVKKSSRFSSVSVRSRHDTIFSWKPWVVSIAASVLIIVGIMSYVSSNRGSESIRDEDPKAVAVAMWHTRLDAPQTKQPLNEEHTVSVASLLSDGIISLRDTNDCIEVWKTKLKRKDLRQAEINNGTLKIDEALFAKHFARETKLTLVEMPTHLELWGETRFESYKSTLPLQIEFQQTAEQKISLNGIVFNVATISFFAK